METQIIAGSAIRSISTKETAQMIRVALKQAFPAVKFSVRTDYFSGGSAVDVRWTDGPTEPRVDALLSHFRGSRFESLDDSTRSVTTIHNGERVRFGARFVNVHRSASPAHVRRVVEELSTRYHVAVPALKESGWPVDGEGYVLADEQGRGWHGIDGTWNNMIHRAMYDRTRDRS